MGRVVGRVTAVRRWQRDHDAQSTERASFECGGPTVQSSNRGHKVQTKTSAMVIT